MPNLETSYLGLKLKNPIIVGSTGLTSTVGKIQACEEAGAGAVVIKSLFEESIAADEKDFQASFGDHTEAYEYLRAEVDKQYGPKQYNDLIEKAKAKVQIPIIASINCVSTKWWPEYARQIEAAGADALELNVFPMVSDAVRDSAVVEKEYIQIIESVKKAINIPVSMKISMYITALPNLSLQLARKGLNGLVMFNRFVEPDIDIENIKLKTTFPFSDKDNINYVLRWIALLAGRVNCDFSATTGIHTSKAIIKLLLAGASTVQLASVLYKHGFKKIDQLLEELDQWMQKHNFERIDQFKGKLNFRNTAKPDFYLRAQFMERIREVE